MLRQVFSAHEVLEQILKRDIQDAFKRLEPEIDEQIVQDIRQLVKMRQNMGLQQMSVKETIQIIDTKCSTEHIYGKNTELCGKFQQWKTNGKLFQQIVQTVPKLSDLPTNGWLSNADIDSFLKIYRHSFGRFNFFESTTADFMFCDFRKDRVMPPYNGLLAQYNTEIDEYDLELIGKKGFGALSRIDSVQLQQLFSSGVDCFAVVVNTDNCSQSGQHWVCFFADLRSQSIDFFNSTGPGFTQQLRPLKLYLRYLKKQLDKLGHNMKVREIENPVQKRDGTCGVYCLLFILCRIIETDPQNIVDSLQSNENQDDHLVKTFQKMLFYNDSDQIPLNY